MSTAIDSMGEACVILRAIKKVDQVHLPLMGCWQIKADPNILSEARGS